MTLRRAAVALAAVSFCLGASSAVLAKARKHKHHTHRPRGHGHGHAASSGPAAEGRAHLKRANALAGDGDCEAAIEEYTKAYELLEDPVVLFNRGECYRRTGDGENAADDYHAFLDKVPNAPNRADIEAKIVALEAPETPKRPKPAEETGPPLQTAPPPPKTAEEPPPSPPRAPPPKPAAVVAAAPAAPEEDSGPSRGSRPWVWIALSVLVAGAAVGGYFMFRPQEQTPPESALGNYRF